MGPKNHLDGHFFRNEKAKSLTMSVCNFSYIEHSFRMRCNIKFSTPFQRLRLVRIRQKSRGQKFFFEKVYPNIRILFWCQGQPHLEGVTVPHTDLF